ncbi:hypothetical protein G7072_04710 [Nocardioides sp. HDW12B]|uniref:hypothetical protein n=1 Tax=Nocardioides sp. HDW12B TaxID=2714939 RepID=UPI00140CBF85|nr:hypothetical protein [Nocardioides sp. HDW12B]QIK65735.1 hypothetical protein G7072_04710 [Nocardioides sp. HDW12B]
MTETTHAGGRARSSLPPVPEMTVEALLGLAGVEDPGAVDGRLDALVRRAGGGVHRSGSAEVSVVSHSLGAPATHGVYRVTGRTEGGGAWSMFCKVIQHPRHWEGLAQMPPDLAREFADTFPWRTELELWDPRVQASLPDSLRSPALHELIELEEDRIAVWQEDVALVPGDIGAVFDLDRYDRAAYLLGRWNARSTTPEVLGVTDLPVGMALRMYAEKAVPMRGLAPLTDDALWAHPWLADHGYLRATLGRLGERIADDLVRLDAMVQCLPHGDASPQNLLLPAAGDPAELVVIDLSFRTPHALGFDLSQLLVGLTQAGEVPAAQLPEIARRILAAYLRGLHDEGVADQDAAVHDSFVTVSLLRSGFDSLLYELLGSEDPGARHAFDERIALTRFLVEQYVALHG